MTYKSIKLLISVCMVGTLMACSTTSSNASAEDKHHSTNNEPTPYDETRDAWADLKAAKASSLKSRIITLVAMRANWCHDSRGLAAQFEKERFQTLLDEHYTLVYINVGKKNRNIDIAQELGVESIVGTPTVFVLSSDAEVLNLDTAPTWRNAASRTEDDIFDYFESFTTP